MQNGTQKQIVSMEKLHEIVNSGVLCGLCTGGVYGGAEMGFGRTEGEYTLWKLEYSNGQRENLYTLN
ncbi:MAG: hypothetical protein HFI39_00050 [Lachnospiraceae bacterium]|nr:hypothetical protein [Lachnospiraceae bacterium]